MRSVVLKSRSRCLTCLLPLRWCVCPAHAAAPSPLQVGVVMHHRECHRPSSTGNLIGRVMTGSQLHLWRRDRRLTPEEVRAPGRELWILHPNGGPPPGGAAPGEVQVLLIDGSWREASAIAHEVQGWGRLVGLPMSGQSRFWLRTQPDPTRFSTVETLLWLLDHFGLEEARDTLRLQFELHVYASLKARGRKAEAAEFIEASPVGQAFPELLAHLESKRPR